MTTPTFTTTDIVNFAAEKDAVKINSAFNDLIGQRVWDTVQSRKTDLAKSMFNPQAESQDMEAQSTAAEANDDNEGQAAETEAALDAAPVETEAQAEPQAEEPVVASAEEQPNTETEAA
jgi:hypothetical protein